MIRTHAFVVTVASILIVSTSHAQDAEQRRKDLFREGTTAADGGDWTTAAAKFREVVALRSAPKALIALAVAEDHLGHLVTAKRTYEKAASDAHAAHLDDDEQAATRSFTAITSRVPVLRVHVPRPARVKDLALDGKSIPARDDAYDVDPGDHTITGMNDEFHETLSLTEGQHSDVTIVVVKHASRDVTPTDHPSAQSPLSISIGALVLGSVGLVGVGIGSGLWGVGVGQDNDVKAKCGGQTTNCPLSAKPEADSANTNIVAGDVVFALGAALALAGATWLIVSALGHSKTSVTGWVAPNGFGIGGRW